MPVFTVSNLPTKEGFQILIASVFLNFVNQLVTNIPADRRNLFIIDYIGPAQNQAYQGTTSKA